MDQVAVVSLALTLAFQNIWQDKQRNGLVPLTNATRPYSREDAIALGRSFGNKFKGTKATINVPASSDSWLLRHVDAISREIQRYESPSLQELALNAIPFDQLNERAAQLEQAQSLEYQDALVQALVEWAKNDFLQWVDPVKCQYCGGETEGIAGGVPTVEERNYGAGRVELYRCKNAKSECQGRVTRFPRYSDLKKLLQTRTGRCGEFAAIFMLLLRALNIRARYVWNSEDHVWNEYYSDSMGRWVHVDSCEGARDKHLLYDQGWGKKMKYCIAFGVDGASDVTRSYVSDWQETLARRDPALDRSLRDRLAKLTEDQRKHRSAEERRALCEEDAAEEQWLSDWKARAERARQESLSGRTSGTKEWRSMRLELGGDTSADALPAMAPTQLLANTARSISRLNANGTAKVQGEQIILTEDKPDQVGSAFLGLPIELREIILTTTFVIKHQGKDGADGMAIVLHSDSRGAKALGQGGCDLGYGGLTNCLVVEIDTYRSVDRCDDPPTPHISIHAAGGQAVSAHHRFSLWCSKPGAIPNVDDGRQYTLRLELSCSRKALRIFFNDSTAGDFVELTDQPVIIASMPETGYEFFGWTAATGGLHQSHVISDFNLWQGCNQEDVQ